MNFKICIVTQSHLCRNPRVVKEATALSEAGYDIHILTTIHSKALLNQDLLLIDSSKINYEAVVDLSSKNLKSKSLRLIRRVATLMVEKLRWQTPHALGYGVDTYLRRCKEIGADLYICHQEMPSFTGTRLIKLGYKVGFDFEDWYSEDLLVHARKKRPINLLKDIEEKALRNASFCITTSNSMAKALTDTYQCEKPHTIYNIFDRIDLEKSKEIGNRLKLIWFSQTVGPGRGLEEFVDALNNCSKPYEMTILGYCNEGYKQKISALIDQKHKLIFKDALSPKALMPFLTKFDIGLALEHSDPPNKNHTISNKLFQYIQSGLPTLATNTLGQTEILSKYDCGWIINLKNRSGIMETLDNLTKQRISEKRKLVIGAADVLNWDIEKKKLVKLVVETLGQ